MKFPKSLHAEGWSNHIDTTTSAKSVAGSPLHATRAPSSGTRIDINAPYAAPAVSAAPSAAPAATPRIDPLAASARPQPRAAAVLPPQRENRLSWMIGAGAGAALLAAMAIWAMNRPVDTATPPAAVVASAEPQILADAGTPATEPAPQADRDAPVEPAAPVVTAPAEPAALPAPKPAAESRQVAQAPTPAARPDLVVRASPANPAPTAAAPTPYLQPRTTIAAAPAAEPQPLTVTPGTAPITVPPTSAGPVAAVTPPPVAADAAASATAVGTPPLAQAQPAPQPAPEDSGITVQVRNALAADSTLAAVPIAVSTDHGVVKLEGQAPDAPTRERATVVAASATGVKAVDNRLTLPPPTVVGQLSTAQ